MSRTYDEECPDCGKYDARIDDDHDGPHLLQCMSCGACFKIVVVETTTRLQTKGTDQKAWNKASRERWDL